MKFLAKPSEVTKVAADLLAVFVWPSQEQEKIVDFSPEAQKLDLALAGMLSEIVKSEDFEAKSDNLLLIHSQAKVPAKRVLLVGLGQPNKLTMFSWHSLMAGIGRKAKEVAAQRVAIALPEPVLKNLGSEPAAQGAVEGISLGTYVFNRHKSEEVQKKEKKITEVWLLVVPPQLNVVAAGINRGEIFAAAAILGRDLVNEPPSLTTPTYLAQVAKGLAKDRENITCEIFGRNEMEKLGMGALLGVARGSSQEPKFIRLNYKGGGRRTICLVGKGITFDAGGLSLKTAAGMETMKLDMAGAAAILGIFKALAVLKPRVNVVGLVAATENMLSDTSIKPGDVVRAMNGKTIEILNTDAEGRVILADALSYAVSKVKPDIIIDLATLTGACMVALGEEIAGLFASDAKLAASLKEAAVKTGERLWELPLADDYKKLLKSSVADIKNAVKTRYGGAITGALFLQEFVPDGFPWAHLDIAGPAFAEKDTPLMPAGGTGFGARLLLEYLLSQ